MKHKILITGKLHPNGIEALQQHKDLELHYEPEMPMDQILEQIPDVHCIVTRSETPITQELMDRGTQLKLIARAAVGVANIDVEYATQKGILVVNTPGKNTNSAAELTLGLLLGVVRNITSAHQNMQQLGWNRHHYTGSELLGKTIGIIGLGNVGHRVALFARGFQMNVLAYDPYINAEVFERFNARPVDLDTLLAESDIVTVHTPKNEETTGILGAAEIKKMKPGVILLNAARGGIIDEEALLAGLQSQKVAGAGIDTWDVEPPKENPFAELPQVVMTPHIGASTIEAQQRIAESIAEQVPRILSGEVADYPVNMPKMRASAHPLVKSYTVLSEKIGRFASQFMSFFPARLEVHYRGSLPKHETTLIRLAFIKGLLKDHHENVSYVNADQCAEKAGIHIQEVPDPAFTDYESAVKFCLKRDDQEFKIGGVVFSGEHPRITLMNDFVFEIEPKGTILATGNRDVPGMIGVIGTILGKHEVNIKQFELSRNNKGGEAMALISIDGNVPNDIVEEIQGQENITTIKKIIL